MAAKKAQTTKKTSAKKASPKGTTAVSYHPDKMTFAVATIAGLTIVVFAMLLVLSYY